MNTQTENKAIINITSGTAVRPSISEHASFLEARINYQIGDSFTLSNAGGLEFNYLVVTPEQAESFARVVKHQGMESYTGAYIGFCELTLIVTFNHIVIGIEPDGYAHS